MTDFPPPGGRPAEGEPAPSPQRTLDALGEELAAFGRQLEALGQRLQTRPERVASGELIALITQAGRAAGCLYDYRTALVQSWRSESPPTEGG